MKRIQEPGGTGLREISLLALEPRMLFDGALAATVDLPADAVTTDADRGQSDRLTKSDFTLAHGTQAEPPAIDGGGDKADVDRGSTLFFDRDAGQAESNHGERISISDPDGPGGAGAYDLSLGTQLGSLTVAGDSGAVIDGNGTDHVRIWGTLEQINQSIAHLQYHPDAAPADVSGVLITVQAPDGLVDQRHIEICIHDANRAPVANADLRIIGEGRDPLYGNVITGLGDGDVADFEPDGEDFGVFGVVAGNTSDVPLSGVARVIHGQFGSLVMHENGLYTYEPGPEAEMLAPGETIEDVFSYLICDPHGNIATTTLTIRIVGDVEVTPAPVPVDPVPVPPPAVIDPLPVPPPVVVDPAPVPAPPPVVVDPAPVPAPPPVVVDPAPVPAPPPVVVDPAPVPAPPPVVVDPAPVPVPPPVVIDPAPVPVAADPLPPTGGAPAPVAVVPVLGDPTVEFSAQPYTQLSEQSRAPSALTATDSESPFQPLAVLGVIQEAEAVQKAARAQVAPGEDCGPSPKPKVVKRSAASDSDAVTTKAKVFSEQIQQEKKVRSIVKPRMAPGKPC